MIRDDYPDDYVTQAEHSGRTPVVLDAQAIDPVAFEEEEPESPDAAIGYGSLLSLGTTIRRKKPLIVVDPVEAENEARRVQFVAAQQLVDPDEAGGVDFLEGLAHFAELGAAEAGMPAQEAVSLPLDGDAADGEMADALEVGACLVEPEASACAGPLEDRVADADPEEPAQLAESFAEAPDQEMAISVAALARIYQDGSIAPAEPSDVKVPSAIEVAPEKPEVRPNGHSLRARMPNRPPSKSLTAHAFAILGWVYGRLARGWS